MALVFLVNAKAHCAHPSSSILFQQTGENTAGKSTTFTALYFRLAKANYMKLMALGGYLRNYIIVVVKSAMVCTIALSGTALRGQWERCSPTLWPLRCSRASCCRAKGWNATRAAKLGQAAEYGQLRSKLSASCDDLKHTGIFLSYFLNKQLCPSRQKEAFNWRVFV